MTTDSLVRTPASAQIPGIMAELQRAADTLQEVGWGVSVFGSARISRDSPYYAQAQALGARLAQAGLPLIAGGGPGIMEAANRGAYENGGTSVGLNIRLPHETVNNRFQTHSLSFDYFYSRKATFFMHSVAYVAMPGGYGTLDELFEVMTLLQTGKIPPAPLVLIGTSYWQGLLDWIRAQLLPNQLIKPRDINELITVTDDLDEVMALIINCCQDYAHSIEEAPTLPE